MASETRASSIARLWPTQPREPSPNGSQLLGRLLVLPTAVARPGTPERGGA
jgi:hypothetical protein